MTLIQHIVHSTNIYYSICGPVHIYYYTNNYYLNLRDNTVLIKLFHIYEQLIIRPNSEKGSQFGKSYSAESV